MAHLRTGLPGIAQFPGGHLPIAHLKNPVKPVCAGRGAVKKKGAQDR
jgi:hypothetical protein